MNRYPDKYNQSKLNASVLSTVLNSVSNIYLQPDPLNKFDQCKQNIQMYGLDNIGRTRPPLPKIDRQAGRMEIFQAISELSLTHPGWGCDRLSAELKALNIDISPSAIYNILIKHQMGTKNERLLKLAERFLNNMEELSAEQRAALEKFDPSFKDRQIRGDRPGMLLAQDTIFVGMSEKGGEMYLQAIVDSYNNYAFGSVHTGKAVDYAVAIIHNEVMPFYKEHNLPVSAIITDNGREYCGNDKHHYELYLRLNDIEHIKPKEKRHNNGIIKLFIKIIRDEFIKKAIIHRPIENDGTIQAELEQWLHYYNNQRPYFGFPNMGKPPGLLLINENN